MRLLALAALLPPLLLSGCQGLSTVQVALVNDDPSPVDLAVTVAGAGERRTRTYHLEPGASWSEEWLLPDGRYSVRFDDGEHPVRDDFFDSCGVGSLAVRLNATRYTVVQGERASARFC